MIIHTVAIVDYGIGNHASVAKCIHSLGYRVRVTHDTEVLDSADLLLLPGVGAFPAAMRALHKYNLVQYLQTQASLGRPIIGICLGMHLLTSASREHEYTDGLGFIPGEVVPFSDGRCHVGWNSMRRTVDEPLLHEVDGHSFYFNHSFSYVGSEKYTCCKVLQPEPFTAVIRKDNIVGLQFHPEKSQAAGSNLLAILLRGLIDAK